MKLVTDGKLFAIRRGNWITGYEYKDLSTVVLSDNWYSCEVAVEKCCWRDEPTVRRVFEVLSRKKKRKEWAVK